MSETLTDKPRANVATLLAYQHEERLAQIESRARTGEPSFKVSQTKSVGGAVVFEWDVNVPVCEEFPTSDEAHAATIRYAQSFLETFPPPSTNGASK